MNIVGNNGDYYDTVRINDVSFELGDWYAVTAEHYKVSLYSSHNKILNFDHVGTNTVSPTEEDYLNHAHIICSMRRGFPCMSLLPDAFGQHAIEVIRGELAAREKACRS